MLASNQFVFNKLFKYTLLNSLSVYINDICIYKIYIYNEYLTIYLSIVAYILISIINVLVQRL